MCIRDRVSGVSLGEDNQIDAPQVNIQYAVLEPEGCQPELVEKMYFDRLLDFVYVELMRGMQKGFVPKRCANCGRWFLQYPGATYAYCDGPAPGQEDKTCREIGATASFQEKVRLSLIHICIAPGYTPCTVSGRCPVPRRRRKFHIVHPAANGRVHSLHCVSSPNETRCAAVGSSAALRLSLIHI